MAGERGDILAVVKRNIVADTQRGSVEKVDNGGTILSALVVAENQNLTWLRTDKDAVLLCTLDVGSERKEGLVE